MRTLWVCLLLGLLTACSGGKEQRADRCELKAMGR